MPIFRSVRLRFLQHMVLCCCGRQEFGERQRVTTCTMWRKLLDWFLRNQSSNFFHTVHVVPRCRSPNPCLPQQQDTICSKNLSLTLLKMGKSLSKTYWADLVDQWIVIVASSWFFYITLPGLAYFLYVMILEGQQLGTYPEYSVASELHTI